jgi:hypothetical protein
MLALFIPYPDLNQAKTKPQTSQTKPPAIPYPDLKHKVVFEREREREKEREGARKVILPKMRLPGHAQFAPKRRDLT